MEGTVGCLINEHSTNIVHETHYRSGTDKKWAKEFPPITNAIIHTYLANHSHPAMVANFDSLIGPEDDDDLRMLEPAYPPNIRRYRLNSEEDGITWFHTEVSNIVLAAFANYPPVFVQASHEKPLSDAAHDQTVDVAYSVSHERTRSHVAIGEFKRGIIDVAAWQAGKSKAGHDKLSRELRGYAYKYACPQVFCFDQSYLLMLQFRAATVSDIKSEKCPVYCWILPRHNENGTSLRYALYRLLVQGLRRCQGQFATGSPLNGQLPERREFFSGRPLFKIEGKNYTRPWGYHRKVESAYGAFYWVDEEERPVLDAENQRIWDTQALWQPEVEENEMTVDEDIYG